MSGLKSGFPWLPLGARLPNGSVGRLNLEGPGYQVVQDRTGEGVHLLLESGGLAAVGAARLLGPDHHPFQAFSFGGRSYLGTLLRSNEVAVVRKLPQRFGLPGARDVALLAGSIRRLRAEFPDSDIGASLFLPTLAVALPTQVASAGQDLHALALDILLGGARVERSDAASIRSINSALTPAEIENFLAAFSPDARSAPTGGRSIDPAAFALPGHPRLERFFREHILEPAADPARYAALKVAMPNGVLLHGPTGSGKSYAIAKLVAALGRPLISLDLGRIASPLVHQAAKAIRDAFDEAKGKAPAVIAVEEIDALASHRGPLTHDHKVEETTELLRMVENAAKSGILVIATTNRSDALDPAMCRKGRFDYAIEVGYPNADDIHAVLRALLDERPRREIGNLADIAGRLAGRPMSDVAWIVNEAARIAARAGKDAIDDIDLLSALRSLNRDR
ncbi:MAG TPA: AAA family ATPase [Xanthobacteraceae bacterium]|nr:AAA family ATPase [Xanthobacteraceae bacterium]